MTDPVGHKLVPTVGLMGQHAFVWCNRLPVLAPQIATGQRVLFFSAPAASLVRVLCCLLQYIDLLETYRGMKIRAPVFRSASPDSILLNSGPSATESHKNLLWVKMGFAFLWLLYDNEAGGPSRGKGVLCLHTTHCRLFFVRILRHKESFSLQPFSPLCMENRFTFSREGGVMILFNTIWGSFSAKGADCSSAPDEGNKQAQEKITNKKKYENETQGLA